MNKIKANITIPSHIKTTDLLEGTYPSIYKGKSMNFENLREYVLQDDVKDIDWKASARSGTLLVKQFIALKKHNIMLVMDTGIKMDADTAKHQSKKEIALYTAGTIGYLAIQNGDAIGMTYALENKIIQHPFRYQLYHLEKYLTDYDKYATNPTSLNLDDILNYLSKSTLQKKIIFIITDMQGIDQLKNQTLKKLTQLNDVLVLQIQDNYMTGNHLYDVNQKKYLPNIILQDKELHQLEKEIRNNLDKKNQKKLKKNAISMTTINSLDQISLKIIELLKSHQATKK